MQNNIENVITVIDYIEDHLPENLDLDSIANAAHYSKYHLHRMFVNEVGLTIHDYMQYRKQGIAGAFLRKALDEFVNTDTNITITTFREGDKADTGYRNTLKKLGFAEAELLVEFGYPAQCFVLHKENLENTD